MVSMRVRVPALCRVQGPSSAGRSASEELVRASSTALAERGEILPETTNQSGRRCVSGVCPATGAAQREGVCNEGAGRELSNQGVKMGPDPGRLLGQEMSQGGLQTVSLGRNVGRCAALWGTEEAEVAMGTGP